MDDVAKTINKELKDLGEESFVAQGDSQKRTPLKNKLEIVKAIIALRQEDNAAKVAHAEKASEKNLLLAALAAKKAENIQNLSEEEIQKRIDAL